VIGYKSFVDRLYLLEVVRQINFVVLQFKYI